MSGLLLGILLARTFSGLIAEAAGWRAVYVAAGAMVLRCSPPCCTGELPGRGAATADRLLPPARLGVHLMRTEPLLRLRSAIGGLAFATFNVIWTSLAFLLAGPAVPLQRGGDRAVRAPRRGRRPRRLVQRPSGRSGLRAGRDAVARWPSRSASVGLLALGAHQLWALIAGIVLADLGIQAVHIQNQQLIFAIEPSARSRLNTGYMVTYFVGGVGRVGHHRAGLRDRAAGRRSSSSASATRVPP